MSERTNEDRRLTAQAALEAACLNRGEAPVANDPDSVTDLLADLRHFCAAEGIDYDNCDRIGGDHFDAEVDEDTSCTALHESRPAVDLVQCDNCPWQGSPEEVLDIEGLAQRLTPGGIVPAGECPECRALAYLIDQSIERRMG